MFAIVILVFVAMIATPFTMEMKVTPTKADCRHVVLTTWFGNLKHLDAELCGDQQPNVFGIPVERGTPAKSK